MTNPLITGSNLEFSSSKEFAAKESPNKEPWTLPIKDSNLLKIPPSLFMESFVLEKLSEILDLSSETLLSNLKLFLGSFGPRCLFTNVEPATSIPPSARLLLFLL